MSEGLKFRLELLRLEELQSGSIDIADELAELLKDMKDTKAYDDGFSDAREEFEKVYEPRQTCPDCGTEFEAEVTW